MVTVSEAEDQPLGYLLYRVQAVLQPAATAALRQLGITLSEFVCMKILLAYPGLSSAQLARANNVAPQSMNSVLQRLEDRGLVTRPAWVDSGRALPAELTRAGKSLLKRAEAVAAVTEGEVLADLTPTQRRQLKRLLGAIAAAAPGLPRVGHNGTTPRRR
jgi:DNA-binding MarR family transcriptional regulator